jgi:hypothetical protein
MGTFIAISTEESDLSSLKEAANAALKAAAAPANSGSSTTELLLQPTGWLDAERRVFVTGGSREQRQQALQYVLPVRSLALARK